MYYKIVHVSKPAKPTQEHENAEIAVISAMEATNTENDVVLIGPSGRLIATFYKIPTPVRKKE